MKHPQTASGFKYTLEAEVADNPPAPVCIDDLRSARAKLVQNYYGSSAEIVHLTGAEVRALVDSTAVGWECDGCGTVDGSNTPDNGMTGSSPLRGMCSGGGCANFHPVFPPSVGYHSKR